YRCQLGRTPIREGQPDPAALGTAVNAVQGLRRNDPPEILSPRGHPDPDRSRRLRLRGRYIRLPPRHCPDAARATDARDRIWMLAGAGPDCAAIPPMVNGFRAELGLDVVVFFYLNEQMFGADTRPRTLPIKEFGSCGQGCGRGVSYRGALLFPSK